MSKELEVLQKLRDLVEYLTRIDYVSTDLRNEVKELLIKSYEDSNGYFSQIEEAIKRNEPMKVNKPNDHYWHAYFCYCPNCKELHIKHFHNYCPACGQKLYWSDEND